MGRKEILLTITVTVALIILFGTNMIVLADKDIIFTAAPVQEESRLNTMESINYSDNINIPCEEYKSGYEISLDSCYDKSVIIEFLDGDTCTEISLQDYLIMVVMSEMPYTFEVEALKAQAIAARTYTLRILEDSNRHGKNSVCNSPAHCSAALTKESYIARYSEKAYNDAYDIVSEAVYDTDGIVITYDGALCCAVYHSSSGDYTENSYNLWGTYTPYLVSVPNTENTKPCTLSLSADKFTKALLGFSTNVSEIKTIKNDSGRCEKVIFGEYEISGSTLRSRLSLKSCDFDISFENGEVTIVSYGYGHGIGMSQTGANAMAESGYNCFDILTHYYTGIDIEILK